MLLIIYSEFVRCNCSPSDIVTGEFYLWKINSRVSTPYYIPHTHPYLLNLHYYLLLYLMNNLQTWNMGILCWDRHAIAIECLPHILPCTPKWSKWESCHCGAAHDKRVHCSLPWAAPWNRRMRIRRQVFTDVGESGMRCLGLMAAGRGSLTCSTVSHMSSWGRHLYYFDSGLFQRMLLL